MRTARAVPGQFARPAPADLPQQRVRHPHRIDAAGKALPYETAKPEPFQAPSDSVPLHERLKEYAREKALASSAGKVVDIGRKPQNGEC